MSECRSGGKGVLLPRIYANMGIFAGRRVKSSPPELCEPFDSIGRGGRNPLTPSNANLGGVIVQ